MDLWIRSQNKEQLIPIDSRLYICEWENGENRYSVSTDIIKYNINNLVLGYYQSKERVLEVLDKIQERIMNLQLVDLEVCVYEMPKE